MVLSLICNFAGKDCTQITSDVAWAKARYSTSVLDLETVDCFSGDHETKLGLKGTVKPTTDFLSSQSESVKQLICLALLV